jgi:hypothetical protein
LTAIARIACEQPETLAHWLAHVAEVEDAMQRMAGHPTLRRLRRTTRATICTWPPSRLGKPSPTVGAPGTDPSILLREMLDVFDTGSAISPRR